MLWSIKVLLRRPQPYRDIRTPRELQSFCDNPGTIGRVSRGSGHELKVELRTLEDQRERPRVIDVGSDVRVEDYGYACQIVSLMRSS